MPPTGPRGGIFAPPFGKIYLDPSLPSHTDLLALLRKNGAQLVDTPSDTSCRMIVLHPSSTAVFDAYCHPVWLTMAARFRYLRKIRAGGVEEWKVRTIVSEEWVGKCVDANKVLGEEEGWGGCRKGGPEVSPTVPVPRTFAPIASEATPATHPLSASANTISSPTQMMGADPENNASGSSRSTSLAPSGRGEPTPPPPPPQPRSIVLAPKAPTLNTFSNDWQHERSPPVILEGFKIFLDKGRYGRKQTMASIGKSKGLVVPTIEEATHALLSPVLRAEAQNRADTIRRAAARGTWCLCYDWLEESWTAGKVLSEWNYVYEGGVPKGAAEARASEEESKGTPKPKALVAAAKHTVPAATPASQGSSGPVKENAKRKMPNEQLCQIFRNAQAFSLKDGENKKTMIQKLVADHPEYTEHTFLYLYSSWKNSTHRFSPYAKDVEYKKHTALFAPLLALVRTGVSLGDIATRLASDHPAYGFSAQAWEVHLGNYLRDLEPHHWTNTSHNRRMELVTIFKRDHDRSELKYVDVIADVSKKTGESRPYVDKIYRLWRLGQLKDVPDDAQPSAMVRSKGVTEAGAEAGVDGEGDGNTPGLTADRASSSSSVKRKAVGSSGNGRSRTKRAREDEEDEMMLDIELEVGPDEPITRAAARREKMAAEVTDLCFSSGEDDYEI